MAHRKKSVTSAFQEPLYFKAIANCEVTDLFRRAIVATFDSEQQLLAYVRWATLESKQPQQGKFEQGSALAGYDAWEKSTERLTGDDPEFVLHASTPNMM